MEKTSLNNLALVLNLSSVDDIEVNVGRPYYETEPGSKALEEVLEEHASRILEGERSETTIISSFYEVGFPQPQSPPVEVSPLQLQCG